MCLLEREMIVPKWNPAFQMSTSQIDLISRMGIRLDVISHSRPRLHDDARPWNNYTSVLCGICNPKRALRTLWIFSQDERSHKPQSKSSLAFLRNTSILMKVPEAPTKKIDQHLGIPLHTCSARARKTTPHSFVQPREPLSLCGQVRAVRAAQTVQRRQVL